MIYEILNDTGEVINRIIADASFVERKYPGKHRLVGPDPVPYKPAIITKAAFRFRLTDEEYVGILSASKTDVEVEAWVETFNMSTQITLDDLRTATGLEMMVGKGLLTENRKKEILETPVDESERPE